MNFHKSEGDNTQSIESIIGLELDREFNTELRRINAWSQEIQDDLFEPRAYIELDLGKKRKKEGSNRYMFVTYAWTSFLHTLIIDRDLIINELIKNTIKPEHFVLIRSPFILESRKNRRYSVITRFTQIPKSDVELYNKLLRS